MQDEPKPRDEKAEARAEAQRKRALENREKSMKAGLDELDRWIGDQLDQGLAAFMSEAQAHCRQMAQRLVDAKVSGLATAVDALPSELFSLPEAERPGYLIERLGGFHLLAEAYRRQDSVSDALRADLRRLAGWAQKREDLLTDGTALRVKGSWLVFAVRSEVQPDRLRRTETWLARCDPPETDDDSQQFAVLMDFNPVAGGSASSPFSAGEFLSAELVFYPSAAPLRALIDKRGEIPEGAGWPARRLSLADALADYYAKLAIQPWLPAWPIVASGVRLVAADGGLGLTAPDSNIALPIDADAHDGLLPLLGLEPIDMFGLWDGRKFSPMAAATPIGPWLGS